MILLESYNRVLLDIVKGVFSREKALPVEVKLCDFDNTSYKITVAEEDMDLIHVTLMLPCYREIKDHGGLAAAQNAFGAGVVTTNGDDVTVTLQKADWHVGDEEAANKLANKVANIKGIVLGGVFEYFFAKLEKNGQEECKPFQFALRPDTNVYFVPGKDRVTTIFRLSFQDKADTEIAKVFLTEFADPALRRKVQRAPPVSFDKNPPLEMKAFSITEPSVGDLGYVSFAVLPGHVTEKSRPAVVECLQTFRNFVQYHMKCAKAYFHSRMRARAIELVKVLNRAKFNPEDVAGATKKITTASGKTFNRK